MHVTINDIIGEKTIDLSHSIQNFDSSKEVAVVSMFSDNIQYKMTEIFNLKLIDNSEKQILNGSYAKREIEVIVGRQYILADLSNDFRIIKTNKLAEVIDMIFNLNELDNSGNLKMEDLVMHYLRIMYLVLKMLCFLNPKPHNTRSLKAVRLFPRH